ncbi:MAG: DUF4271 domain-containing protein [Lachnospiraceae bacterium]|nr:DUF4271 domain-containing protein [Prevotella sp.]MCM1074968.1 DUF4271 domain-containing protein [Ruminococcus sp.]MCM1225752.1 DUF4271 domain-containing protein [Lachnospiraceae bacterium]
MTLVSDSIHSAPHPSPQAAPAAAQELQRIDIVTDQQLRDDREMLQQALSSTSNRKSAESSSKKNVKKQLPSVAEADSLSDSSGITAASHAPAYKIHLDRPAQTEVRTIRSSSIPAHSDISSWIILGVIVLFLLVAFRFRSNFKYLRSLLHEAIDSPKRRNLFADTFRETTFSVLLIAISIIAAGMLLACAVNFFKSNNPLSSGELPPDLWQCLAVSAGYFIFQWIVYLIIGNSFTSPSGASRWIQGFKAGVALTGPVLMLFAVIGVFYPSSLFVALVCAAFIYFLSRILFILKGIKIFSGRSTYFLLFLYYLCSVEIVPLVLIWHLANLQF